MMAKILPFSAKRAREVATYALTLSARWQRSSKTKPWLPPRRPERLGNLLQQLAAKRPAVVFVIEIIIVEMLRQLDEA